MRALYTTLVIVLLALTAGAQTTYGQFVQAFDNARRLGTEADVDKAIKDTPYQAMYHFVALSWDYKHRGADDTEAARQMVRGAWTRLWQDTTTLQRVERFVNAQTDRGEAALASVGEALQLAWKTLEESRSSADRTPLERLFSETLEIARAFEEYGDILKAAEAWGLIAQINEAMPQKTTQDRTELISALRRFVELRENWSWTQDAFYAQNKHALEMETKSVQLAREETAKREEEGYSADASGMEAMVMPNAEEQVSELKFAMLKTMEIDMFVKGGDVHMMWPSVALRGEEPSPGSLLAFKKSELYLTRPKSNDFVISPSRNPDSKAVTEVAASSRPKPALFYLDEAKTEPYAMWFYLGSQSEKYMMAEMNMSPSRDQAEVFYRSAASWTTTINDENVIFYDDNLDGLLFSTDAFDHETRLRTLGEVTDEGIAVPAYDSMRIGSSRSPRVPFSGAAKVGDTWYHLRGVEDYKVGARELNPDYFKIGEVKMVWNGSRNTTPKLLVIQGRDDLRSAAFDISSGKPIEVPAGDYQIGFGRIIVGRGARMMSAHIFQGDSQPFTVTAGETFELNLGEELYIDFVREGTDMQLKVDSTKMRVLDQTGALYAHMHGAVVVPEVVATVRADGRGARPIGEFIPIEKGDDPILAAQPLLGREALGFAKARSSGGGGRGSRSSFGQQQRSADGRMLAPGAQLGGGFRAARSTTVLTIDLRDEGLRVGVRQLKHPLFGDLLPVLK